MSGIYQLNQATGSVTLPISGNTFIGTSDNSELYTVDSAGNVTIYGTGSGGGGGSIDTGSFAVTASNSFTGSQTISGSVEITGSVNSNVTVGVRSQGLIQITDDDTASVLPAYNTTGSINGMFLNSGSDIPISFVGTTEFPSIGGLAGGGFIINSGSSVWSVGGQYTAGGGIFTQLYYNPNFSGGNENYLIQVGDTGVGENRLIIQKADASNEGIQLKASDITEGFVLGHNFSNPSASLFKVRDSGSINTIFDIRSNSTVFTQVSESLDFADDTAAGIGGVPLGGLYRSGSDIKIRMT